MQQPLSFQIQLMRQRRQLLYQSAHTNMDQQELLPKAFDELDNALEKLQALEVELHKQQMRLLDTRERLEAERQEYQELFECAPVAYLITSPKGTIRRVNWVAAALFQTAEQLMSGRSLTQFVPEGKRRAFRAAITQLSSQEGIHEWEAYIKPSDKPALAVAISVESVRGWLGNPMALRWIMKKLGRANELSEQFDQNSAQPLQTDKVSKASNLSQ